MVIACPRGLPFDHAASQVFQLVVLLALTAVALAHLPSATGKGKSLAGSVVGGSGATGQNADTASGFAGQAQAGKRPWCGTSDLSPSRQVEAEAEAARLVARHVNATGSATVGKWH